MPWAWPAAAFCRSSIWHIPLPQFMARLRRVAVAHDVLGRVWSRPRCSPSSSQWSARIAACRCAIRPGRLGRLTTVAVVAIHIHGDSGRCIVCRAVRANSILMLDPHFNPVIRVHGLQQSLRRASGARRTRHGSATKRNIRASWEGPGPASRCCCAIDTRATGAPAAAAWNCTAGMWRAWRPRTAIVWWQSYGVTFQNGALISSLTVAQNVAAAPQGALFIV